jgi:hypothetical protein
MKSRTSRTWWPLDPSRILVFDEKHTRRYFSAISPDAIHKVALVILKERIRDGWIYEPDAPKIDARLLDMTDEGINTLTESLRETARGERSRQRRLMKQYEADVREFHEAKAAVAASDGAMAFNIIESRNGYEYEGFTFENLENV